MRKFSFVILHYQTTNDTIKCVESILENVRFDSFNIIIVDNGSTNNSGQILREKYLNNYNIQIIESCENLGFAKGNNLGYNYAKYSTKSDFICLLNNDTYIEQENFIEKIVDRYDKSEYHILGPDIISVIDGRHQNPNKDSLSDLVSIKSSLNHYRIMLFLNYFLLDKILVDIKKQFFPTPIMPRIEQNLSYKTEQEGIKLHGSCLIFSEKYISKYEGLYPKTFMYAEESILNFISKRDNLISVYFPDARIYHKEDSSTDYEYPKSSKKRQFYYANYIDSLKVLIELIKKENEK